MNLAGKSNPYRFAQPITDVGLFSGRNEEREEVDYYLSLALREELATSVALLGERASGKTSLLNIVEKAACEKGFLTARIDLDEDDATSSLLFFFKIFDALLIAACEAGAFGGTKERTYQTYLNIVHGLHVTPKPEWAPFLFPLAYAHARKGGHSETAFSGTTFKRDLGVLYNEVQKPLLLLIDEGDILRDQVATLEKLRNLIQATPHFMVVIAGTPSLFPALNDVFSPITRQFKRISVGRFETEAETQDCIERPLRNIGLEPGELCAGPVALLVGDVHQMTSGNPYEIQLACHLMFKRVERGTREFMGTDRELLDAVLAELESSGGRGHPMLEKIRRLTADELSALSIVSWTAGRGTWDIAWKVEQSLVGEEAPSREWLQNQIHHLCDAGVCREEAGCLSFLGSAFDEVFLRYFAREQGAAVAFIDFTSAQFWEVRIRIEANVIFKDPPWILGIRGGRRLSFQKLIDYVLGRDEQPEHRPSNSLVLQFYRFVRDQTACQSCTIVEIEAEHSDISSRLDVIVPDSTSREEVDRFLAWIGRVQGRASAHGWCVGVSAPVIEIPDRRTLAQGLSRLDVTDLRGQAAALEVEKAVKEYRINERVPSVLEAITMADLLNGELSTLDAANLGYMLSAYGCVENAIEWLEAAIAAAEKPFDMGLALYNRGVAGAKTGTYERAMEYVERARELLVSVPQKERILQCGVKVSRAGDGKLIYLEVSGPDVLSLVDSLRGLLASRSEHLPVDASQDQSTVE